MPSPKVLTVKDEVDEIVKAIRELRLDNYTKIELHFHGSPVHSKMAIRPEFVLIKAMRYNVKKNGGKKVERTTPA